MNIIKLQDMLRGVPDNALIGYVQNPQGEVPSYLALSELQRRKDTRAKFQQQQTPETSVAEDLGQEAVQNQGGLAMLADQPQQPVAEQGVASLPVDEGMYNEQNFAGGGIVAFENGGDVQNFDEGGTSRLGDYFRSKIDKYEIDRQINALMSEKNKYRLDYLGSYTPEQRAAAEARNLEIDKQIADLRAKRTSAPSAQPSQATPVAPTPSKDQAIPTPPPPPETFVPPAFTTGKQSGSGLPKLDAPEQLTIDKAIEDRKEAMRLAGVDPNFYTAEVDKLNADREALKADREQAGWLALTKAGLSTMAGTSPFALVNLGKGAEAGIDQYGKDVKDIKAEDRLLKQADRKLSEAQYLQSRGDAEGAQKKIAERDALIQDYKKIEYQGKVSLAAASMSANRPDINMELLNSMRQDAEYYKKDAKGNLIKDAKGQPIFDASKAANAIKGYDVKSESNALKALSDQLKTEYDPVKRKAIQEKIDAILAGEGNVPSSATKTPTKPLSSFGG
jgi:hypothetical protein